MSARLRTTLLIAAWAVFVLGLAWAFTRPDEPGLRYPCPDPYDPQSCGRAP